jgi:pimeloyl-ACP methyl ester carboxylesterase
LNGELDDPRLPFSVLDPVVGDVFSILWEPEMIRETGSALRIMTAEILSQIGQTVLAATAMTALMSALQWPISKQGPLLSLVFLRLMLPRTVLTKLGYLIDNPWSNALDRSKAAGSVLADILIHRHLGVRPITLIGFSLGARVIFYALLELAKQKAFGVVQDVILLGATLTAPQQSWLQVRTVVSGRFVNGFARNDWVLNYLFRATTAGVGTVAGLRPVENIPGLENIDVTDKISGHISYRTFLPLILDQLGFPVSADHFDEPEVRPVS